MAKHSYVSHVQTVKIADLKNNLSRYLSRVRRGGELTVYDRDTPIARSTPSVWVRCRIANAIVP